MKKEFWKKVDGYDDYLVSDKGRVKSLKRGKERVLKFGSSGIGYKNVKLYKGGATKTYLVHSLVALAFIGKKPKNLVIDHKNSNIKNNNVDNLHYVTQRFNTQKRRKLDHSSKYVGVHYEKSRKAYRARITVNNKRLCLGFRDSQVEAAKLYNNACVKYGFEPVNNI